MRVQADTKVCECLTKSYHSSVPARQVHPLDVILIGRHAVVHPGRALGSICMTNMSIIASVKVNRDFLGPQDTEGSTSLVLIKPGTMIWVPGLIKILEALPSISCGPRKSLHVLLMSCPALVT